MFLRTKEDIRLRLNVQRYEDLLKFPRYFEFETINACNARCIMCPVEEWKGNSKKVVSDTLWEKFVYNVAPYKDWIEKITLTRDGEPLLDKKLSNRVRDLKEAGIKKVVIVTNAQVLTPKKSLELLESGIDEVMFSVDGLSKEVYEKIRRGLEYEKVLSNIMYFIALRNERFKEANIRLRFIEQEENKQESQDWLDFWKQKISAKDSAYVMPLHSWGNQVANEEQEKITKMSPFACISPFGSMAIHYNGLVGLCGVDYNTSCKMGDLREQSIEEIWRGESFSKARENHLTKNRNSIWLCRGCDLWDRNFKY